jgi:outer membrane immunogenic protein
MTRFLQVGLAAAAATAMTFSAQAADMPVYKAMPAAPVASSGWNGFYLGVNAGGSIGTDSTRQTATFSSTAMGTNGLLDSAGRYNPIGWVAGGQIGFNWQVSSFVFGLEADWQGSWQQDSRSACTPAGTLAFFGAGANGFGYCLNSEQKITNFGTARARAGVDRNGALWYVTGGFAWGTVKEDGAFVGSANTTVFPVALQPGPFLPGAASFSSNRTGWTLGAGVETMIAGGWSAKLEYLYVDLGEISNTLPIAINPAFGPGFTTGGVASATNTSRVIDNIVRVGLNYRFGGDVVYAKY